MCSALTVLSASTYLFWFVFYCLPCLITESMTILEPFPSLPVPVIREQQRASGSQREVDYRSARAAGLNYRHARVARALQPGRRAAPAAATQLSSCACRARSATWTAGGARALRPGRLAAPAAVTRHVL